MTAKTFAILIVTFMSGALALAQTASEIDNCCFVDRQCHNDSDWVAGYWAYQNGQCPAPQQQSVVLTSPQPQPANIDNCCFAGWQCNTDAEWVAGYWAYQNGQCPVPQQQSVVLTSPQPQPANIDNCCFAGWQCNTDAEWVAGYWAHQNGQCSAPSAGQPLPANGDNCCSSGWLCSTDGDWSAGHSAFQSNLCERRDIHLNGSARFIFWMNAALDALKSGAPEWYVYSITGLREIRQYPDQELYHIGAFADVSQAQMGIAGYQDLPFQGTPSLWEQEIYINLAGVIVHEACHVQKWRAGIWFDEGWRNELPCHEIQLNAVYRITPASLSWMIAREQEIVNNYRQYRTWWGPGDSP